MSTLTANNSIVEQFNNAILNSMRTKKINRRKNNYLSAEIQFSAKEIKQMAEPFKRIFELDCGIARILKFQSKRGKCVYEIRYYRHGINISVCHTDLRTAKEIFIKATETVNIQSFCL